MLKKKFFHLKKNLSFFLDIFVVATVQESRTQIFEIDFEEKKQTGMFHIVCFKTGMQGLHS